MRRIAAPAVLAALLAAPAAAESRLTLCNRDDRNLKIAVVEEVGLGLWLADWQASGWYEIAPNACRDFGRRGTYQKMYLSITEITDEGREVRDYGVDAIPDWLGRSATYGVERFFCVSDDPFERRLDDLAMHEAACPAGYYLQLFNSFLWVEDNSDYKLTLN